jgi:hypothetical protein
MHWPRPASLLLSLLVSACDGNGSSGGSGNPPADARQPGYYEITTRVGNVSGLGIPPEEQAALSAQLSEAPPTRRCQLGGRPRAGDPFEGGRCRYSRVADQGTRADRTVSCTPVGGSVDSIAISGTATGDGYSLRLLTRRTDAATGRSLGEVETFEQARRIGDCPQPRT